MSTWQSRINQPGRDMNSRPLPRETLCAEELMDGHNDGPILMHMHSCASLLCHHRHGTDVRVSSTPTYRDTNARAHTRKRTYAHTQPRTQEHLYVHTRSLSLLMRACARTHTHTRARICVNAMSRRPAYIYCPLSCNFSLSLYFTLHFVLDFFLSFIDIFFFLFFNFFYTSFKCKLSLSLYLSVCPPPPPPPPPPHSCISLRSQNIASA